MVTFRKRRILAKKSFLLIMKGEDFLEHEMIESVNTAIQVVETLKKQPLFEAKYRVRIDNFRNKLIAQQAGKGTLTPDVLIGILSGMLFAQKVTCAYDLGSHPIHETIIVAAGAVSELLVAALEP